jgi:hypothetical protein
VVPDTNALGADALDMPELSDSNIRALEAGNTLIDTASVITIENDELPAESPQAVSGEQNLSQHDRQSLKPGQWINDSVIDAYQGILAAAAVDNAADAAVAADAAAATAADAAADAAAAAAAAITDVGVRRHLFIGPASLASLHGYLSRGDESTFLQRATPDAVRHIHAIINEDGHWYLVSMDVSKQVAVIYDSLGPKEGAVYRQHPQLGALLEWSVRRFIPNASWELHVAATPRQDNSSDCGVFAIGWLRQCILGDTDMPSLPVGKEVCLTPLRDHIRDMIASGKLLEWPGVTNTMTSFKVGSQFSKEALSRFVQAFSCGSGAGAGHVQPPDALGFADYVRRMLGLRRRERRFFTLTGVDNDKRKRWGIDATTLPPVTEDCTKWIVDVDSVMWVGDDLPAAVDLVLQPVVNQAWTLTRSNHLEVDIGGEMVPMHQIPNFQTGLLGSHFRLVVFFPRMRRRCGRMWVNMVKTEYYAAWYDRVVRPALEKVVGATREQHYPINYAICAELSRTEQGHLKTPTYNVPCSQVPKLIDAMRDADNDDLPPEMRGWFYHVYAKDLKLALSSEDGNVLDNFWASKLNPFDPEACAQISQQLVFDVGIDLTEPSTGASASASVASTLLWHGPKLMRALESAGFVKRIVDPWCGLRDIAGMRGTMSRRKRANHILWAQFYHLDKNPLYSKSSRIVGKLAPLADLHKQTPRFIKAMDLLKQGWQEMRERNFGVRAELRVTATAAAHLVRESMAELAGNLIRAGCVLRVDTAVACDFRRLRLEDLQGAAHKAQKREELRNARPNGPCKTRDLQRYHYSVLLDLLIKSLVSRPQEGFAYRGVIEAFGLRDSMKRWGIMYVSPDCLARDAGDMVPPPGAPFVSVLFARHG